MLSSPRNIKRTDDEKHKIENHLQNDHSQTKMEDSLCIDPTVTDLKIPKNLLHIKKKLNNDDIAKNLEMSSDESEIFEMFKKDVGKKQNNLSSITLRFSCLRHQFMYTVVEHKIGISKMNLRSIRAKDNLNETQKKLRNMCRTSLNYNYNYLCSKQEEDSKKNMNFDSQNTKRKSINKLLKNKEIKEIEANTRKRSVGVFNKFKNVKRSEQESENEVDENRMHNANTNFCPKRLKTMSTSKQNQIESNFKTSKNPRKSLRNLIGTDTKLSSQLKTPFKGDTKFLKNTCTKSLSKLKTSLKSDTKALKVSMNTPTKVIEELNLNDSTRPRTRRLNIKAVKANISLQNMTSKKSNNKLSKVNSEKINKISTRKRSAKFIISYDSDSVMDEDEDDSRADEDFKYNNSDFSEDEDSSKYSKDEITDSEDENSVERFHDIKRGKFTKRILVTPRKTPKSNIKTPSKTLKKATEVLVEIPSKRLSRLSLKNSLSPSVHQRTANIAKPSSPLQEVRLKLHVSVLPKSLPCREEQFNSIYTYLHARLLDGTGGCIYISGVPGTGKTATVNEVIRCLKKSINGGKLTKFDFVDVNGMKLSEPRQAYVEIWKQLTRETVTWEAAHKLLQNRFTKYNSKQNMILLLVDELDLLCTKRQDVVYNLLDWPSKSGAKLVVVTIANTMDLPERILMGRVTSRLGLTRLTFPPYNHKQLEQIVLCRLKGYNVFSGETVQLVARKVAAVSGDARRALDICRRSTEIAETNDREIVSMIDVKKALDEMIASPKIQAIKHCSDMEKVFLKAVCTEIHRTGVEEVVFKNVYFQLQTLCTFNGERVPNVTEALFMCARLGSWRLLLCDHSKMDIHQRLLLNVTTDDVHFAIEATVT